MPSSMPKSSCTTDKTGDVELPISVAERLSYVSESLRDSQNLTIKLRSNTRSPRDWNASNAGVKFPPRCRQRLLNQPESNAENSLATL